MTRGRQTTRPEPCNGIVHLGKNLTVNARTWNDEAISVLVSKNGGTLFTKEGPPRFHVFETHWYHYEFGYEIKGIRRGQEAPSDAEAARLHGGVVRSFVFESGSLWSIRFFNEALIRQEQFPIDFLLLDCFERSGSSQNFPVFPVNVYEALGVEQYSGNSEFPGRVRVR